MLTGTPGSEILKNEIDLHLVELTENVIREMLFVCNFTSPVGHIVCNSEGLIVWANDYARRLFGYGWPLQMEKLTIHDLAATTDQTAGFEVLFSNPVVENSHCQVLSGKCRDGSVIKLHVAVGPLAFKGQKYLQVYLFSTSNEGCCPLAG